MCIWDLQCFETFRNCCLFCTFWHIRNFYCGEAYHTNYSEHSLNDHFQHCAHCVYDIYSICKVFEMAVCFAHIGLFEIWTALILTMLQSVAKLVTHSAIFWNFLDERRTTAKKNNVSQISPRPPNQCWSLFPALWSFRVWSTLCRGEGGKFNLGLGCSKIGQQRSSVSLLLKPIVRKCRLQKYAYTCHF